MLPKDFVSMVLLQILLLGEVGRVGCRVCYVLLVEDLLKPLDEPTIN